MSKDQSDSQLWRRLMSGSVIYGGARSTGRAVGGISTDTTGSILLLEVTHFSSDFDRSNRDHDKTQIELSESSALTRSAYAPHPSPGQTSGHARDAARARHTAGCGLELGAKFGLSKRGMP